MEADLAEMIPVYYGMSVDGSLKFKILRYVGLVASGGSSPPKLGVQCSKALVVLQAAHPC